MQSWNQSKGMASTAEEDLLRMSLTGSLPQSAQKSFDEEKDAGNVAFKQRRYQDAVRHYTAAEQINPLSPVPPANRAMAYIKLSKFENAKADAAVALELYNALPKDLQSPSLPVKILLRRATANFELMLYALAAEDYEAVLNHDPRNQVAKDQLNLLKEKYGITPGQLSSDFASSSTRDGQPRIELLSEAPSTSTPQHMEQIERQYLNGHLQDETALLELPKDVMNDLVSRWSTEPPKSAYEFERVWKSLHKDKLARARYLIHTVGASRIAGGLLGESLTPQLLEDFVAVLTVAVEIDARYSTSVADVLFALTKVSRFDMLLLFLSPEDKRPLSLLLNCLGKNGVSPQQISALTACYT